MAPCSGKPLSEQDAIVTYDSITDFTMVIDDSEPTGEKLKRVDLRYIFGGWTNGDMIIRNNTESQYITFQATNSSSVTVSPCRIDPDLKSLDILGFIRYPKTSIVIASGAISASRGFIQIDTEAGAATDNLDTINGGENGYILILMIVDPSRAVTVRHGIGNIKLEGGVNFILNTIYSRVELFYQNGFWNGRGINIP